MSINRFSYIHFFLIPHNLSFHGRTVSDLLGRSASTDMDVVRPLFLSKLSCIGTTVQ